MPDEGVIARERLVRNAIEQAEFRYAKYISETGKEGVVFGFNLLDPFGRAFAASHVGAAEVDRIVSQFDPARITPAFWFTCSLHDAMGIIEAEDPDLHKQIIATPAPADSFLVVGVSHNAMLPRWLPKPAA